ncbi:MAG: DUF3747 domain-containing protein [Cyanobacteria bacterium P01_A01_bin.83]
MKLSLPVKLATMGTIGISAIAPWQTTNATEFSEFAVDQSQFVAVAIPYNYRRYRLAIIEQIPGQQACWRESESYPTQVDLLLLDFDHTNSCRRGVDTNGYSLRYNGKDDKVEYTLDLIENDGKLDLVADHADPNQQDLVIGSTSGIAEAPMKIDLNPEWQFTKRLYQGGALQHIYMSNNPHPQVLLNVPTLAMTNDPANFNNSQVVTLHPQPLPSNQSAASQPITKPVPLIIVEGFITNVVMPLSQAVFDTYKNLLTCTKSSSNR